MMTCIRKQWKFLAQNEKMEECAICKDVMTAKTFDDTADEGLEGTCFRLSCKHAFHATCIVGSLRASGANCPICRDGAPVTTTSQIFAGFQYADEEEESENPENTRLLDLQNSNIRVRAAASNLNRSVKGFNVFRDKLRSHKRRVLAIAMREVRSKYQRAFNDEKERVRQCLHAYRASVHAEDPDIDLVDLQELLRQESTHAAVRRQDPMRTSFWYY